MHHRQRRRRTSPSSPVAIQRFSSRYHGRNRQFSCTIRRTLPVDAPRPAPRDCGEGRRQRLLAQHVDAARGGGLDPGRHASRAARRRRAHRSRPPRAWRRGREDRGDAELVGAAPARWPRSGSQTRHHPAPPAQLAPGDQMVPADHPGAGERDPQRLGAVRSRRHRIAHPRSRTAARDCPASTRARSASSGSQRAGGRGGRRRSASGHVEERPVRAPDAAVRGRRPASSPSTNGRGRRAGRPARCGTAPRA